MRLDMIKSAIGLSQPLNYSKWQFRLFRIIFGIYLIIHFTMLIPYGPELFSRTGLIANPEWIPTYSLFPNLLLLFDTPLGTQLFLGALAALAMLFTVGWKRPWIAFVLWYGWACLLNRNIFINNPGLPMVGWILLACALIPDDKENPNSNTPWEMPAALFWGAWFIMAFGYTVSGIHKMSSPSWPDGTAILRLLQNPLARDVPWREWLLLGPQWIFNGMTYFSLGLELFFLPLALFVWTRPWVWLAMVGMHLGILSLVSFADLTTGVLMIHLFTFDSRWIKPCGKRPQELILFFDGVCGLCNSAVDFVMAEDREKRFKFSALQSGFAAQKLRPEQIRNLQSMVVSRDGKIFEKSNAVLEICAQLGGVWRLAEIFRIIPDSIRDAVYSFVATNRYRWFGKRETCRMPTLEERARFVG